MTDRTVRNDLRPTEGGQRRGRSVADRSATEQTAKGKTADRKRYPRQKPKPPEKAERQRKAKELREQGKPVREVAGYSPRFFFARRAGSSPK